MHKQTSISRNLTIGLSLVIIGLGTLALGVNYWLEVHKGRNLLADQSAVYTQTVAESLKYPLWNLNTENIEMAAKAYANNELIVKLIVQDSLGQPVFSHNTTSTFPAVDEHTLQIKYEGDEVGAVTLALTDYYLKKQQQHMLLMGLTTLGIIALVVFGLTRLLLQRFLGVPLASLKQTASQYAAGRYDSHPHVPHMEFKDFVDTLHSMGDTIQEQMHTLQSANALLSEAESKYRGIFENAREGLFQLSPQGHISSANPALAAILGFENAAAIPTNISILHTLLLPREEDRTLIQSELEETGQSLNHEVEGQRNNGSRFWAELNIRELRDETLHLQGYEGSLIDMTERKTREKAERDREVALKASETKSEFLANMSHEIRTPLNAVMGMTDLLKRTELSRKQQDYLKKIKIASKSLLAVINDILDFSKIEAGQLELEQTNFSLYEVMANISEMFAQAAHEKEIELAVSIAEDVPIGLVGDPVRLGQVLINLVSNAIKFTTQGEVVVSVATCTRQPGVKDQVCLEFSVRDTGAGIAPDRVGAIFESFSQEDTSTTRKHGGSGLGLSICKKLTRLMGGDVGVKSVQGKGSTFFFTSVFLQQEQSSALRPAPPRDLRGLRVLVVDDNATSREILASGIASFQMEAITASSGEAAIETIKESTEPFDLILMDWKMPGLNGLETAKAIKRELKLDKLPIICMVSAYGREDLLQQTEKSMLDAFLHKPINQSLLFDTIMGLFGRQSDYAGQCVGAELQSEESPCIPEHLAGARILLVEDNLINQEVACEWLETGGMVVTMANNGRLALETLENNSFDAILMDIQMPEMDGLEATRRIRTDSRFDQLPIIAMTAHALKGDRERGIEAGMDDYITKPIDPRKLFESLAEWIKDVPSDRVPQQIPARTSAHSSSDAEAIDFSALNLPGIATESGLYRANNKPQLYLKLLRTFLDDFSATEQDILNSLPTGDMDTARRLAHSVKGVAGNIGAVHLSGYAASVEMEAAESTLTPESSTWTEFASSLQEVLQGLADNLPKPSAIRTEATSSAVVLQGQELAEKLHALQEALDDDLAAAQEMMVELRPSLLPIAGEAALDTIVSQIDEFDIDSAAEALESILEKVK